MVRLKRKLREALREEYEGGIRHCICGMASRERQHFAEAVLRLLRLLDAAGGSGAL